MQITWRLGAVTCRTLPRRTDPHSSPCAPVVGSQCCRGHAAFWGAVLEVMDGELLRVLKHHKLISTEGVICTAALLPGKAA